MNTLKDLNSEWINKFKNPLIIAGPCSAETKDQTLNTALNINTKYVDVFRAGVWKPRTKPNNFEGVGEVGLKWLNEVKKKTNMLVATEVATVKHVEQALKHDIDILWIGARSTVNPFTVQEIAEALYNTNKIILVKNPTHVDIEIWIGSIERLLNNKIKNIGIIHRGFSVIEKKTTYRNQPKWNIILKLKKEYPNIPFILDPSHITGDKNKILEISKKAIEFGYQGLMIETHINPDKAWSDSAQQITPQKLDEIIEKLLIYKKSLYKINTKISQFRDVIDEIDENIIINLYERMNVVKKIGKIKKREHKHVYQPDREKKIYENIQQIGSKLNISIKLLEKIFKIIQEESIKIQNIQ
jgi:chorismate mutase